MLVKSESALTVLPTACLRNFRIFFQEFKFWIFRNFRTFCWQSREWQVCREDFESGKTLSVSVVKNSFVQRFWFQANYFWHVSVCLRVFLAQFSILKNWGQNWFVWNGCVDTQGIHFYLRSAELCSFRSCCTLGHEIPAFLHKYLEGKSETSLCDESERIQLCGIDYARAISEHGCRLHRFWHTELSGVCQYAPWRASDFESIRSGRGSRWHCTNPWNCLVFED